MKNTKGITLVALVITVIILLILAGISIQALIQTNLFEQAKQAKNATENAQKEENEILSDYINKADKYLLEEINVSIENISTETHTPTEIKTYTWPEINKIAKTIAENENIKSNETVEITVNLNGKKDTIGIGDTKLVNGKKVRILGFNHDTLSNSEIQTRTKKAGISFEFVDFLIDSEIMNNEETNDGGWEKTKLRTKLNKETKDTLIEIKDYIKEVKKEYIPIYNKKPEIMPTTDDYLWLLSCGEIFDNGYGNEETRGYAIATEGKQYKYYQINLGNTKYNVSSDITKKQVRKFKFLVASFTTLCKQHYIQCDWN